MSSETAVPPLVRFPHRPRRGLLLGLTGPQLVVAGATLAAVMSALTTGGLASALRLAPLIAVAGALVFMRRSGRTLAEWAPLMARYLVRRERGQLTWLARPGTGPVREGLLHLPGAAGSLRVVTAPSRTLSAIHDPHAGTLTAVVRVASTAFALADPGTQSAQIHGWGRALAALARTGHIRSLQVLERTVPDSGDALHRHWTEHGDPATPLAGEIYADLVAAAGPAAAPHETYVALAFDLKAARRLIQQAGGGLRGAFTVLEQTKASFTAAARNAGLTPVRWLTAREIAAVVRSAYDPQVLPSLQRWSPGGSAQAHPAAAGPVVQIEEFDRIRTDSAFHATYWVQDWPRTDTSAGFLHSVLFTSGVRRAFSLHYRPASVEAALRDVRRRKAAIIADAHERSRRGQVDSEADSIEYTDAQEREQQLVAGHADVALTGLLTVSAATREDLNADCSRIETAAVSAQVDLRRLYAQQGAAFTAAALPLALAA
ncbi:hypothetical protein N0X72_00935 [Streptomyces carpaticus]|uniref:SCO6880 family protein n=1 Tax=Streptomyces carpaticus TaxID=285558 RepID=UPI002203D686|nr:hypothetical protein N0X72_00935 [Streptomyces carpaticus]